MKKIKQILWNPEWLLIIIPVLAYRQVAFFQYTMQWDMTDQAFVWHRFISECFHQHILPLWCPYSRLGYPFFADPQSGLFYPVTWVLTYFFHYSLRTNNLEFILHVIGAAFGMRFLLRTLSLSRYTACIFGLVYALSGPFVSNATHIILVYSLCWIPYILAGYIRLLVTHQPRYALLTAVFIFLQLSGGYIGLTIILIYVLAFIFLYYFIASFTTIAQKVQPLIFNHMLLFFLSLMLSAGFLYAIWQGLPYIDRSEGVSKEMANSIAFTPACFLTFVFPSILNSSSINFGTDITMRDIYVGILPILLLLASLFPFRRFSYVILIGAIFFLCIATGQCTPLRSWLYDHVPLMNMFRMSSIFRFFSCIGFIVLAAFGFDETFKSFEVISGKRLKRIFILAILIAVIGCLMIFIAAKTIHAPPFLSLKLITEYFRHVNIGSIILFQGLFDVILLALALSVLENQRANVLLTKYLFAGLLLIDLFMAVQMNVFSTIVGSRKLSEIQNRVNAQPQGFPIVPNVSLSSFNQWNDSSLSPPLVQNGGFLRKQITFDGFNGYNLNSYNLLAGRQDFFKIIGERTFICAYKDSAIISITKFDPNDISFAISGRDSQTVLIGQIFFKDWKIKIDNMPNVLEEDTTHLMKCSVPAGNHLVTLSFEAAGVKTSFIYTIVIFLSCLIGIVVLFSRGLFCKNDLCHIVL